MTIATFNSGCRLGAGLIGLALALPSIAQDAQVEALAKRADAIAVVEMAFVPYGNSSPTAIWCCSGKCCTATAMACRMRAN